MRISRFLVLVSVLLLALAIMPCITIAYASSVPLDVIKERVKRAYEYLLALKRTEGFYAVIAEYPSIPVVVYSPNIDVWWVPGLRVDIEGLPCTVAYYHVVIRDQRVVDQYGGTSYVWYMDLKRYCYRVGSGAVDDTLATLRVAEYRGYPYSYVAIEVVYINDFYRDIVVGSRIYVAGDYVGEITDGAIYAKLVEDSPLPSMRTSVRHVDVVGAIALANLAGYYMHEDLWRFAQAMMFAVFQTNKPLYDIYNSIFQGLDYTGLIEAPNEWHFYDAQWFDYGLGYYKILEFMEGRGWVWRAYPIYPYKSKVVAFAEKYGVQGGAWYLSLSSVTSDPLYHAWWGLYYCYIGDYSKALEEWNYIVSRWDGTGIYVSGQNGYSTVRLAMAIILGSILADKGYISWDTVHDMVSVLVQLQWNGWGYYSPDGSTIIWIVKPDHEGGFMVSYGKVGSYGYVPFRSPVWESIVDLIIAGTAMEPEYGGVIITNAETTILSMVALMQYAYRYYGVPPSQLLS